MGRQRAVSFNAKHSKEQSYSFNKNFYPGRFQILFLMFSGGIEMAAIPDSRSSWAVFTWRHWVEAESSVDFLYPGPLFRPMPQISTTRPNFPSWLFCISIMDISLPPSRKQCVSLLLLGSVMAAPGEEARLIHRTVLQPHLCPESLKASMREDLGFRLLRVHSCGSSLKVNM